MTTSVDAVEIVEIGPRDGVRLPVRCILRRAGRLPARTRATGNVATEDVAWMFERMGVKTGIDIPALVAVAMLGTALPGGLAGGRVRAALAPKLCRTS